MLRTGLTALLLLALLAVAASCGSAVASPITSDSASFIPTGASLDKANSIGADNAQLWTGGNGSEGSCQVVVKGLQDAKAVYGEVRYDPTKFHLTGATTKDGQSALTTGAENANDELVMIADQPDQNRVQFGMVLADWPNRQGITGDLTLATLTFASGPAQAVRSASKAPGTQPYNDVTLSGSIDGANKANLSWKEALAGDGNNDGEVNVSDLTPLGAKLRSHDGSTATADADYNKDGEPNVSDLSAMGLQLGATLGGYKILSSPTPTGTYTEIADIARTAMFPQKPPLGEVTWNWTSPAALTGDISYKVVGYDNTTAKALAKESNVVTLHGTPNEVATDITDITFDDPNGVVLDNGGTHQIILTEESVDGTTDNAPPFSLEHLQLHAIGDTNLGTGVDITDQVLWYVTDGGGLADVTNTAPGRGDLTFHDRGSITVTAQLSGNFNVTKTIDFQLLSIEAVDLQGPGASPFTVSAGGTVPFTVMGTFDSDDNIASGNEQTIDITPYVGWSMLQTSGPSGTFSIDVGTGDLSVDAGGAGSALNISASYPKTDTPQLNDNQKRASPIYKVTVN